MGEGSRKGEAIHETSSHCSTEIRLLFHLFPSRPRRWRAGIAICVNRQWNLLILEVSTSTRITCDS